VGDTNAHRAPPAADVQVVFAACDPRDPGPAALLAAMSEELIALYGTISRLDLPKLDPAELAPPDGAYLVGTAGADDGTVVAGGGLRRLRSTGPGDQPGGVPDGAVAEIKRMYVVPAWRGRGVAARLLAALESEAAALGFTACRLDTGPRQPHARRLYEHAGYREIPAYNDNPFAVFWGEKRLDH
jgi:GNAT superfamily N-acetyltransferase